MLACSFPFFYLLCQLVVSLLHYLHKVSWEVFPLPMFSKRLQLRLVLFLPKIYLRIHQQSCFDLEFVRIFLITDSTTLIYIGLFRLAISFFFFFF